MLDELGVCLLIVRSVGRACDGCTNLLAYPTNITHWFHDYDVGDELAPKLRKKPQLVAAARR